MLTAAAVHRLRRIAQLADAGEPLGEDGPWLATSLRRFLCLDTEIGMEEAFGLAASPGQATWRADERRRLRDDAIRAFATEAFPDLAGRGLHLAVAREVRSYETNSWPRDRRSGTVPSVYRGKPREHLFTAFWVAAGRVPASPNGLAAVLDRSAG